MDRNGIARRASRIAMAGAVLPIAYGVLACAFRYPHITARPFEVLWAVANVGMIANLAAWLSLKVARPRLALIGGGLAIACHLIRIAVSVVIEVRPDAAVDTPIAGSVVLMFAGLALLGVATLRAGRLSGWPSRAPLLVLLGGLIAAPFYAIDKVAHFILLGLLWGTAWLFMACVGHRQLARSATAELGKPAATLPSMARRSGDSRGRGYRPVAPGLASLPPLASRFTVASTATAKVSGCCSLPSEEGREQQPLKMGARPSCCRRVYSDFRGVWAICCHARGMPA